MRPYIGALCKGIMVRKLTMLYVLSCHGEFECKYVKLKYLYSNCHCHSDIFPLDCHLEYKGKILSKEIMSGVYLYVNKIEIMYWKATRVGRVERIFVTRGDVINRTPLFLFLNIRV